MWGWGAEGQALREFNIREKICATHGLTAGISVTLAAPNASYAVVNFSSIRVIRRYGA